MKRSLAPRIACVVAGLAALGLACDEPEGGGAEQASTDSSDTAASGDGDAGPGDGDGEPGDGDVLGVAQRKFELADIERLRTLAAEILEILEARRG